MSASETRLVLIRHGESVAQEEGFLSGHDTCRGLSDGGRAQAMALRDRLLASRELEPVDVVYTSILPRTIETASIIAPALGEVPPASECDWCEIHIGEAEGLTPAELDERFPVEAGSDDPYARTIPGAESWPEFAARAGTRLRRIADEHAGERVVVVCHGGIITASFVALADLPMSAAATVGHDIVNTSLTEWRWSGSSWHLVRFNDAAHLS